MVKIFSSPINAEIPINLPRNPSSNSGKCNVYLCWFLHIPYTIGRSWKNLIFSTSTILMIRVGRSAYCCLFAFLTGLVIPCDGFFQSNVLGLSSWADYPIHNTVDVHDCRSHWVFQIGPRPLSEKTMDLLISRRKFTYVVSHLEMRKNWKNCSQIVDE